MAQSDNGAGAKAYLDMNTRLQRSSDFSWAGYVRCAFLGLGSRDLHGSVTERNIFGVRGRLLERDRSEHRCRGIPGDPPPAGNRRSTWTPRLRRDWESFRARVVTHEPRWHYWIQLQPVTATAMVKPSRFHRPCTHSADSLGDAGSGAGPSLRN